MLQGDHPVFLVALPFPSCWWLLLIDFDWPIPAQSLPHKFILILSDNWRNIFPNIPFHALAGGILVWQIESGDCSNPFWCPPHIFPLYLQIVLRTDNLSHMRLLSALPCLLLLLSMCSVTHSPHFWICILCLVFASDFLYNCLTFPLSASYRILPFDWRHVLHMWFQSLHWHIVHPLFFCWLDL